MRGQRDMLELLDRRYSLVADIMDPAEFLLELIGFLEFFQSDRRFTFYVEQMIDECQHQIQERDRAFEEQERRAIELRHELGEICPDLDDSDMPFETVPDTSPRPSGVPSQRYLESLAYFEDIVNGTDRWPSGLQIWGTGSGGLYEDNSKVKELLRILTQKVYSEAWKKCCLREGEIEERCESFMSDLRYLSDEHSHAHRDFVNRSRISPGASFLILRDLVHPINPPPTRLETSSDVFTEAIRNIVSNEGKYQRAVQQVVYGTGTADSAEQVDIGLATRKLQLRRVYEGLRALIGSHLAFSSIVEQYKVRCENYERMELLQLIDEYTKAQIEEGKRIYLEDLLTRRLALYLYDNGYPVYYRLRAGGQEPDLLSTKAALDPIVIEAKVVGRGKGEEWIWEGLRALHSYLEKCYSEFGVITGYLVVFRVGDDEIFSFTPGEWQVGSFLVVPKLINLGGTSKRENPVIICQDEWDT